MQEITAKRVFIVVIAVFSLLMVGCAGMEKKPANRGGAFYHHRELVQADQALDEARRAGKDKECPAEFNALKDKVDEAYKVYFACHTQEAIAMANEATAQIKALCPAKPKADMKPGPKPVSKPEPASKPEPKTVEKVVVLEDVHFDLDKSTLTKEAQAILKQNIRILKDNPNAKIRIQGHTSAIASEEYNQNLSERRSMSVQEFLVKEGGVAPARLSTIGYGETRLEKPEPDPARTESAAAKTNRRVIFKILVE